MRLVRIATLLTLAFAGCSSGDDDDTQIPEPEVPEPPPPPGDDGGGGGGGEVTVVDVMIHDDFFDPADITVAAGTMVRWTHAAVDEHSVTSGDNPAASDAGALYDMDLKAAGDTCEHTFNDVGLNPYHCKYHFYSHGMAGTVTVE